MLAKRHGGKFPYLEYPPIWAGLFCSRFIGLADMGANFSNNRQE
jgi:hypothetical protein